MQTHVSVSPRQAYVLVSAIPTAAPELDALKDAHRNETERQLQPRKLLLIEDHQAMVDGMMPTLQKDFQVEVVNSLPKMEAVIAQDGFSLAIVDLTLLGQAHGLSMMPRLRDAGIDFLVFSGTADEWHIRAAIRMGAKGYVDKRDGLAMLYQAIATVEAGEVYFPAGLLQQLSENADLQFPKRLGSGEIAVMDKMFEMTVPGTSELPSNKEIGDALHLSPRRITNIFNQLFAKFDITNGRKALFEDLKKRGYFPGILLERQKKKRDKS